MIGTMGSQPARAKVRADAVRSREQILDAAVDVFSRSPTAPLDDVVRASGLARATVYGHFPSRHELLRAVVRQSCDELGRAIEECRLDDGPAPQALDRFVSTCWERAGRFRAVHEAVIRTLTPQEVDQLRGHLQVPISRLIERGQRDGTFTSTLPSRWLTHCVDAMLYVATASVAEGSVRAGQEADLIRRTLLAVLQAES